MNTTARHYDIMTLWHYDIMTLWHYDMHWHILKSGLRLGWPSPFSRPRKAGGRHSEAEDSSIAWASWAKWECGSVGRMTFSSNLQQSWVFMCLKTFFNISHTVSYTRSTTWGNTVKWYTVYYSIYIYIELVITCACAYATYSWNCIHSKIVIW